MRTLLMAVLLTLSLSVPAWASPITTMQFSGVLTNVSASVSNFVAPGLASGNSFLITIAFSEILGESSATFSLGNSITGQAGLYGSGIGTGAYPVQSLQATTVNMLGGSITTPPVFVSGPWAPPGGVLQGGRQTLFSLNLNQGWQSGSLFMWPENAFTGGAVQGKITSMTRVPEPATALLLAIGVAGFARRRMTSRQRTQGTTN